MRGTAGSGEFYDPLELRSAEERSRSHFTALPGLIQHAIETAPAIAEQLAGTRPEEITSPKALAELPVMRKSSLVELQRRRPPLGGLNGAPMRRLAKVFMSPGPIFEPEGSRPDYWRFARALYAAGIRAGDLVHNSFAYHLVPAGSMVESGARALGCPVFPGGTGQTDRQLEAIDVLRPAAYVGTPSFLKILLERGRELKIDTSCLKKALVSGEAFPQTLAKSLEQDFEIRAFQCYASADLGLIAYETKAREGLVIDEEIIVEILRPGTGEPLPPGEVGEVVVTVFNPDYPLIRFATGDLSAIMPSPSPCGRTAPRLRGWLGRVDQTTKIKGMFVHPAVIMDLQARLPTIKKSRLVVERENDRDAMTLFCEVDEPGPDLEAAIKERLSHATGLNGAVMLVTEGTLANDGKIIDDRRDPA